MIVNKWVKPWEAGILEGAQQVHGDVPEPTSGMDFRTKYGFSIIPSKQQVLHAASGCTFSKASIASIIRSLSTEPAPAVTSVPPKVQKLLKEFPTLLQGGWGATWVDVVNDAV